MVVISAVVVLLVLTAFTLQSVDAGRQVAYAICKVVTFGGECGSPGEAVTTRPAPSEPCVVNSTQVSSNREVAVVIVTAKDGRSFEVSQLSDGTYRVTRVAKGGAGVEVGVGGGVSLTVNDNRYGGYAGADVGAGIEFEAGEVYIAHSTDELKAMINEEAEDTVEDTFLGNSPARWLWERGQDLAGTVTGHGDYEFGTPDEVYAEGGVVVEASAEATALADSAAASFGETQGLGVRTTKDGKTTLYLKTTVEGEADLQQLGVDTQGLDFSGGGAEGKIELLTSVTFDSSGNMIEVGTEATAAGDSKGIVAALFNGKTDASLSNTASGVSIYQAKLPIANAQDRNTALAFLAASGVSQLGGAGTQLVTAVPSAFAMANFRQAAADRGTLTEQQMTSESNTPFAIEAAGKLEIELGVKADVSTAKRTSTGGRYWDGTQWQAWAGCSA